MSTGADEARPSPAFGVFLIAVAVVGIAFAMQIEALGVRDNSDPGPRAFPVALCLFLLIGGAVEIVRARPGRMLEAMVGVCAYLLLLPHVGFTCCSLVLAALLMKRLGAPLWLAATMPVLLVVGIKLLFNHAFTVQLPEGMLEEALLRIGL